MTPFIGAVAQAPRLFASTALSQVITGLTNGTTYTFSVSAVNSRGAGPGMVTGPVTVGAPTAPPLVTATAGNDQAGVAQAPVSFNAAALTRIVTGLTQGVSYTFRVEAINARGASPLSNLSNAVTPT